MDDVEQDLLDLIRFEQEEMQRRTTRIAELLNENNRATNRIVEHATHLTTLNAVTDDVMVELNRKGLKDSPEEGI